MFQIWVNFKTYPQGTGKQAVALAQVIQRVQEKLKGQAQTVPVVQAVDLARVKQATDLPVWVQHVDYQPPGRCTGWTNLEAVIEAGATGTLLNHSEHPLSPGTIKQFISRKGKLAVLLCCRTLGQMARLVRFKPDYLGYEISELIGTKTSITKRQPKAIKHAALICGKIPLVVGAGIHQGSDLKTAQKLGAQGVLVSSDVLLAPDPEVELRELVSGLA